MILFKKAIRSMLTNKKAYIACIVLIMIGIFVFVSLGIASYSLDHAKNVYYEEYSFPDCFASVNAIATTEVETLANIGGIEKASGRLVYDSRVIFEDNDEIITLRLSTSKEQVSGINDFYLAGGNYLSDINDIMLSEEFLLAHNLAIGGTINLNIEGKEYTLNICGTIQSPEYVYAIKDEKTVLPDPATFSFAFLTEGFLSSAVGKQGIYNDLSFILESGTTFGEIEIELEDTLNRYGLTKLYDRDEHLSYVMLDTEVESNKSMVTVIPSVFIMMSMAILYLMLKRVIEQERTQIGTLKAFGYSNLEIVSHYLMYGLITGFIGGLLGVILGYFIADTYIDMYSQFYKMPSLVKVVDPYYIIWGLLISVMGGALGSYMGARGVIKLDPADSMRSKAPKLIRHDILLVFPFLKHLITSRGSMAIRSIQRSKFRSLFIIIGIMFSFSLMAFMGSFNTMIDAMMLDQFQKIQVYDVKISFKQPVNFDKATDDIKNIRHVTYAEALFETPVLLKNKHLNTGISIVGMDQGSLLYKIYDSNTRKYLKPPTGGVIISDALARELGAKRGDYLIIESQFSSEEQKILVWDVVTQNLGMGCYMEANAMSEFFETQKLATSVIFRSDDIGY
ncbi:MAG: ABC transporter permease, partial [Clostridiales bacterium]|nr:ABC transporter permease [Clostridiales bacterium]